MSINHVIFLGKSKKKTGNTRFMLKALQRRVGKVIFINLPRYKKYFFWTDYRKAIGRKIIKQNPDLVLIYSKDIPYSVLAEIRTHYQTAMFYPDHDGAGDKNSSAMGDWLIIYLLRIKARSLNSNPWE